MALLTPPRQRGVEILDDPGVDSGLRRLAQTDVARSNRVLGGLRAVMRELRTVLPELDEAWLRTRLSGDKGFVWVQRELSPAIQEKVMRLGIPGIDFITESKRFYPGMNEASHILGSTNIDN